MILVPVKNLDAAKQRLGRVLTQEQRTLLARTMLEDVCAALAECPARPRVSLVTGYPFAVLLARHHGFEVIEDKRDAGETEAIAMATVEARKRGADFTLVLPGDIPLVTGEEIARVLAAAPAEGSVLVTAADGRGTNAVLRRPCALFPLRFGNDSFAPHHAAALASGKECVVLEELPGIALDVDRPADLAQVLGFAMRTRTQRLLCDWKLPKRWRGSGHACKEERRAVSPAGARR